MSPEQPKSQKRRGRVVPSSGHNLRLMMVNYLIGGMLLIPMVVYWGAMFRYNILPPWMDYPIGLRILGAVFPWGLVITALCLSLAVGVFRGHHLAKIITSVIAIIFAWFWTYFVNTFGGRWSPWDTFWVNFALFLFGVVFIDLIVLIFRNLKKRRRLWLTQEMKSQSTHRMN